MATIRIYDLKERILALDLRDLLRLLAPRSLEANWIVSTVKSSKPGTNGLRPQVTATAAKIPSFAKMEAPH